MKKILFFVILLLSVSCGEKIKVSGHRTEIFRAISGYDKIEVSDGIRAYINYAEEDGIVVKTFSSVHDYVKTYVSNGTLYVEIETNKQFSENPNVVVTISAHDIQVLNLSGGVKAKSEGVSFTHKEAVVFNLSGGSSFEGELLSDKFDTELSGGSSFKLTGNCVMMTLSCSGGSNSNCADFQTDLFSAEMSGGSKCEITVNDRINKVSLSGGSKLYYKGTRIVNDVNVSGGSELISRN